MKPKRATKRKIRHATRPDAPFSLPPRSETHRETLPSAVAHEPPSRSLRRILREKERAVVGASLLILSAAIFYLAFSSVSLDSATDDEPAHIVAGYVKLKHGHFDLYREQPPLINSLSALPLLFEEPNLPPVWRELKDHWMIGHIFLYQAGNDADRILLLARLPIMILFLLLCWLAYGWVRHATSDRRLALLAFTLTGFCPSLLAHGRLATVDLGVSFFIALAAYGFLRFLYEPTAPRSVWVGAAIAAAALSKVSGLIVLPYLMLVFFLYLILEGKLDRWEVVAYMPKGLLMLGSAWAIMEALFLLEMNDASLQQAYPNWPSNVLGALLVPLEEYWGSIEAALRWVAQPYNKPQFFLGSFSFTGWWHFYPVAFVLKTPIAVIVLFLLAIFLLGHMCARRQSLSAAENKRLVHGLSMVLFIALFLTVSSTSKVNLGVRYILPIYPFVLTLIPLALIHGFSRFPSFRKRGSLALLGGLILWSVASSVASYPGYLSYFNEFIGERRNADRYLIDSDLDWGQDLRRLAHWVNANGIEKIRVGYVGGGDPRYYLGEKVVPWPSMSPRERGYYAISRHYYRVSTFYKDSIVDFEEFFAGSRYVTTVGGSIDVYYVE